MTKKFTYVQKNSGDALTHTEWNNLAQDVEAAVNEINEIAASSQDSQVTIPQTVLDTASLFNNEIVKTDDDKIKMYAGKYQMQYLTPTQASGYSIIPPGFLSSPAYESYIYRGISQFVINNVSNGYTYNLQDLATGLTISTIPNQDQDHIVFAITSVSSSGTMDDSNTKIVVLDKIYKEITISDIITLVHYYKTNNIGPWAN